MDLLLLAEGAATAMPEWGKYVLGPLGVLVLLLVYAYRTEKYRIPLLSKLLSEEQKKNDELRDDAEKDKDELRKKWEERVAKVQAEVNTCREKYTKERGLRTWWQAQAQAHGVKEPVPEDIDKTSFGSFSD